MRNLIGILSAFGLVITLSACSEDDPAPLAAPDPTLPPAAPDPTPPTGAGDDGMNGNGNGNGMAEPSSSAMPSDVDLVAADFISIRGIDQTPTFSNRADSVNTPLDGTWTISTAGPRTVGALNMVEPRVTSGLDAGGNLVMSTKRRPDGLVEVVQITNPSVYLHPGSTKMSGYGIWAVTASTGGLEKTLDRERIVGAFAGGEDFVDGTGATPDAAVTGVAHYEGEATVISLDNKGNANQQMVPIGITANYNDRNNIRFDGKITDIDPDGGVSTELILETITNNRLLGAGTVTVNRGLLTNIGQFGSSWTIIGSDDPGEQPREVAGTVAASASDGGSYARSYIGAYLIGR